MHRQRDQAKHANWGVRLCFWLMIALVDNLTAVFWYDHFDQPDFYFRGPGGILVTLSLCLVVWLAVGGFAELVFRRYGQPVGSLGSAMAVLVLSTGLFALVHYLEFDRETLAPPFIQSAAILALYTAVGLLWNRLLTRQCDRADSQNGSDTASPAEER